MAYAHIATDKLTTNLCSTDYRGSYVEIDFSRALGRANNWRFSEAEDYALRYAQALKEKTAWPAGLEVSDPKASGSNEMGDLGQGLPKIYINLYDPKSRSDQFVKKWWKELIPLLEEAGNAAINSIAPPALGSPESYVVTGPHVARALSSKRDLSRETP